MATSRDVNFTKNRPDYSYNKKWTPFCEKNQVVQKQQQFNLARSYPHQLDSSKNPTIVGNFSPFFSSHYYFSLFFFNLSSVTRPIAMTSVLQDSKRRWKSEVMASFHNVKWAGSLIYQAKRYLESTLIKLQIAVQISRKNK